MLTNLSSFTKSMKSRETFGFCGTFLAENAAPIENDPSRTVFKNMSKRNYLEIMLKLSERIQFFYLIDNTFVSVGPLFASGWN